MPISWVVDFSRWVVGEPAHRAWGQGSRRLAAEVWWWGAVSFCFLLPPVKAGGFSGGSAVKNLPAMQEDAGGNWFHPWVGKMPWRKAWQPTPVFLLENPQDRGAWQATGHGVAKSRI